MVYKEFYYNVKANFKFARLYFDVWDHIMFVLVICVATIIGFYYGYLQKHIKDKINKKDNAEEEESKSDDEELHFGSAKVYEYLLASRKMSPFPVAMSLTAFWACGVVIVGLPTEVYYFGTQIWMTTIGIFFSAIAIKKVYLPVFFALRIDSSYQYLEMRYNSTVRSIGSFLFILDVVVYLPFIFYVPSLAYSQATGINLHIVHSITCVVCIAYTIIGGIRAVVHTNAWQCLVLYISIVVMVIYGWSLASDTVIENAFKSRRLIFFNMEPSLYDRYTVWSTTIGNFCYFTAYNAVNQSAVQRYMVLPSYKKCAKAINIYIASVIAIYLLCIFVGLLIYDAFHDCDPISAGYIDHKDQLVPFYMTELATNFVTLAGLLIGGLFCAGLSTLSCSLNSVALVIMEDIVKGTCKIRLSEYKSSVVLYSTILILGFMNIFLVYIIETFIGVFSVMHSFCSIGASVTFGIFTMGMLIPWTNSKGATVGAFAGLLITSWIVIGQYFYKSPIYMGSSLKLSVDSCPQNSTIIQNKNLDDIFPLYRISYYWINVIGTLTTMLVGVIVSFMTTPTLVHTLDATLMSPVIHRFLPPECWRRRARSYDF